MKIDHELKTSSQVFWDLVSEIKTWEFRLNDRGYKVGQILKLREFGQLGYTENFIIRKITYILKGPDFNIPNGYCIMSIIPINEE